MDAITILISTIVWGISFVLSVFGFYALERWGGEKKGSLTNWRVTLFSLAFAPLVFLGLLIVVGVTPVVFRIIRVHRAFVKDWPYR